MKTYILAEIIEQLCYGGLKLQCVTSGALSYDNVEA